LVRHPFRLSLRPGRPHASPGEQLAIIAAITRRQPDQAGQPMRRYLRSVMRAYSITISPETPRGQREGW
jgi:DNA-binding GntR family transcriptional regulator